MQSAETELTITRLQNLNYYPQPLHLSARFRKNLVFRALSSSEQKHGSRSHSRIKRVDTGGWNDVP